METCKYGLGASTRKPPTARWVWRWVLSPHFNLLNLLFFSLPSEAFRLSLPGEILHASQTAGKGRKGKQTAGNFTEYPTRQARHVGELKGHL